MRILIGCEYSGRVRDAFARRGHTAVSCDLRPTEAPNGWHVQGDVLRLLDQRWDLLIAHPYCTFNANSSNKWLSHPEDSKLPFDKRRRHPSYPNRWEDFLKGVKFFKEFQNANVKRIAIENSQPHGHCMERVGKYSQIIQPWMFGVPESKGAALWLTNLPLLVPTHKKSDYDEIHQSCWKMGPGPEREKERSRTHKAVAEAFAAQWGDL